MLWNELWDGFDWDEGNSSKSWLKHGISQAQCEQVFRNRPLFIAPDEKHSELEERGNALGTSDDGTMIQVAFTMRGTKIRPISTRRMNRKERKIYAQKSAEENTEI